MQLLGSCFSVPAANTLKRELQLCGRTERHRGHSLQTRFGNEFDRHALRLPRRQIELHFQSYTMRQNLHGPNAPRRPGRLPQRNARSFKKGGAESDMRDCVPFPRSQRHLQPTGKPI